VRDVAYYSLLKRQRREAPTPASPRRSNSSCRRSPTGNPTTSRSTCRRPATPRARRRCGSKRQSKQPSARQIWRPSHNLTRRGRRSGKLPAGLERDNLELNAQIALIGPTIALQGWGADAVADVSSRAIELCRALDNDPRIFPALYARWSYLRVASDVREAGALARDFLTLAELKGTRADRMVGHRLHGTSLLDGETEKARDHLERATKLYDATADRATAVTYGTDVQVTSLSNLGICCLAAGRVSEAVAQRARRARICRTIVARAYPRLRLCSRLHAVHTERDAGTVQALAQRLLARAIERELPTVDPGGAVISRLVRG